jgi:MFS family permease
VADRSPRLGRTVKALAAVSFLTDVSSEMIYPLLPLFLASTLGASAGMVGLVEGTAESVSALLKLASGWWSDRVGRRKPLVVVGYAVASIARPLVAVAQSVGQVLAIRVTDRVGKGIRTAPRDAMIADTVDAEIRGRAFGFHRAADHAGAVVGPLVAWLLLELGAMSLRSVFALAAIPAGLALLTVLFAVREPRRAVVRAAAEPTRLTSDLPRRFWLTLGVLFLFTLGNSTDAFLLLRARDLGVPAALVPLLWAMLHVVKSAASTPGGALSDRFGRRPVLLTGWVLYAAVYLALGFATAEWQVWALFAVYGVYFGLTEGVEKALIADLVPASRRGAAFGWFNLAIAAGALPASVLFGVVWDSYGASAAFTMGAALALAATAAGSIVISGRRAAVGG